MAGRENRGLSPEDVRAAEVLGVLRKAPVGQGKRRRSEAEGASVDTPTADTAAPGSTAISSAPSDTLLNRMVNNVVTIYDDFKDRRRVGSIARLLDDAYEDNYTSSESESEDQEEEEHVSKRQKISEALAKSRDNLKEYKLNMSIESKKRLITCLHLLKLANKQLADKVNNLQDMVREEQEVPRRRRRRTITNSHDRNGNGTAASDIRRRRQRASTISDIPDSGTSASDREPTPQSAPANTDTDSPDEDCYGPNANEEFFDAFDSNDFDEKSTVIKMEVVGTIKKVYALISSYTGDSLPEPARSQVRESLLSMPNNWFQSANAVEPVANEESNGEENGSSTTPMNRTRSSSSASVADGNLSANGKVLLLAKESLEMVQNVMDVVDSTLGKAEEWVKQKQEVKEMFLKSLLEKQRQSQMRLEQAQAMARAAGHDDTEDPEEGEHSGDSREA